MRRTLLLFLVPLLGLASACGSGSKADQTAPTDSGSFSDELNAVRVTGGSGQTPFQLHFRAPFSVQETQSKVLEQGDGPAIEENATVLVDYVGANGTTGKEFDSSWSQGGPQAFPLVPQQMIIGFITGLVGQRVGSEVLIAMPPADAYGAQGNPQAGISGTDTLLFAVHVLAINDQNPLPTAEGKQVPLPRDVPRLQLDEEGQPTGFTVEGAKPPEEPAELGVYPVIRGDGPVVRKGDLLTVHYIGQLYPDGEIFDESWDDGEPVTFQIGTGSLIKGWDEGLVGQRVGSRVVLVVPPEYGYGAAGAPPTIPGGASLIFAVDILGVGSA